MGSGWSLSHESYFPLCNQVSLLAMEIGHALLDHLAQLSS
jgi:hypothetical protein